MFNGCDQYGYCPRQHAVRYRKLRHRYGSWFADALSFQPEWLRGEYQVQGGFALNW